MASILQSPVRLIRVHYITTSKGFHSIALLALVDVNYKFLYVDAGALAENSQWGAVLGGVGAEPQRARKFCIILQK